MIVNSRNQATIEHPVTVHGYGYWSGLDVRVQFRPAQPGTGIVFVREDVAGHPSIVASVESRADVPLRTSLRSELCQVEMVEHVMSALVGMKIDNCEVWVTSAEMPGLDGSCLAYVRALQKAGRIEQDCPVRQLIVDRRYRVENENGWIEATPCGSNSPKLKYSLDFSTEPAIGQQEFEFDPNQMNFPKDVAPARTFITEAVAQKLQAEGMGSRVSYRDLLVFDKTGPIENQIRFSNECARHKLLDLMGDLSLAGHEIIANIHSCRGGHALNAQLVSVLLEQIGVQPVRQAA